MGKNLKNKGKLSRLEGKFTENEATYPQVIHKMWISGKAGGECTAGSGKPVGRKTKRTVKKKNAPGIHKTGIEKIMKIGPFLISSTVL